MRPRRIFSIRVANAQDLFTNPGGNFHDFWQGATLGPLLSTAAFSTILSTYTVLLPQHRGDHAGEIAGVEGLLEEGEKPVGADHAERLAFAETAHEYHLHVVPLFL